MTSMQTNTWPPLISGVSSDAKGNPQLYGQEVLASVLVQAQSNDWFYNPSAGLSGYAANGKLYAAGVVVGPGVTYASWFTEAPGSPVMRGPRPDFPTKALVLVTDAGVSILDLDLPAQYALWMIIRRGDGFGFTDNFRQTLDGFTPGDVTYQSGRIMVTCYPDPGSTLKIPYVLTFDLVQDQIYLDRMHIEDLNALPPVPPPT